MLPALTGEHMPGAPIPCMTCRCPAGYSAAVIYVVIAMLLYNVQQDIEQPFDMEVGHTVCLLHRACTRAASCCCCCCRNLTGAHHDTPYVWHLLHVCFRLLPSIHAALNGVCSPRSKHVLLDVLQGLDDVFFEVGEEVLEEVMEPIDGGSSTAAGEGSSLVCCCGHTHVLLGTHLQPDLHALERDRNRMQRCSPTSEAIFMCLSQLQAARDCAAHVAPMPATYGAQGRGRVQHHASQQRC